MKQEEHRHQAALIMWAKYTKLPPAADVKEGSTVVDFLLAIPNGGRRDAVTGARLKAEGVKPGVSDLFLPLRRQGKAGIWLEMKAPGERPTKVQREWLERMDSAGYIATWCDNWVDAARVIADYVGVTAPVRTMPPHYRKAA